MQIGVTDVAVPTDTFRQITHLLLGGWYDFVEVSERQRDVVFEAITIPDDSGRNEFAQLPNGLNLPFVAGDRAIQDVAALHGRLEESVQLLFVVVGATAGSLDEHVEWEATDWTTAMGKKIV